MMTTKPVARYRRISASEAADLIARHRRRVLPELALYDVRDRESFASGHIDGAEHLDDRGLERALRGTLKRIPVVVYCYHGNASQVYAATFADFRFSQVFSVDGGFEPLAATLAAQALPRMASARDGDLSEGLFSFLNAHGFDCSQLDSPREHGLTPLMRAALAGRADLVDELLRLGAEVGHRNADGNNALWLACVASDATGVRRLIEAGIDVDNRNDTGATALMYASSSGKAEMVRLLLDAGADARIRNQDDARALDLASSWDCLTLLRFRTSS